MSKKNGRADKLTLKQRLFVNAYIRDFNATRAAIAAGYSEKTAYSIGHENLRKPEIKAGIEREVQHLVESRLVSRDAILLELCKYAFNEREKLSSEVAPRDSIHALALLGKHFGMFQGTESKSSKRDYEEAFELAASALAARRKISS